MTDTEWIEGEGRTFEDLIKMGRVKAGTVIEVRIAGTRMTFLVGDINLSGGVCDDCTAVRRSDVVLRYRQAV